MYDNVLVTGGAGFIGSALALRYKRDHPASRVLALDNLKRRGSELNLERLRAGGVEFVHGDVRSSDDFAALAPFELLVDCAAEPSVLAGYGDAARYLLRTNLVGTIASIEAAARHRADVVLLSTSRVYPYPALNALPFVERETRFEPEDETGTPGAGPDGIDETFALEAARTLYGATKLCSEILLREYADTTGARVIIDRCGVVAGPWQLARSDQGVVGHWVAAHVYSKPLNYIGFGGTGKQVRDVLHVDDLCELVMRQVSDIERHDREIYNVGGGRARSVSLLELTALCREATSARIAPGSVPDTRPGDVRWYVSDASKVQAACAWQPRLSLEQTVEEVTRWIVDHRALLEPVLG